MKAHHVLFVVVFCVVGLASFSSYATEVEAEQEVVAEPSLDEQELVDGCQVTVYCNLSCGPLVACTGTSSCIGGYDWVECDGVRSYCHYRDIPCEIDCDDEYMLCEERCPEPPEWGDPCGCEADYDDCVWDCCFG